jgi:hypothetical protein
MLPALGNDFCFQSKLVEHLIDLASFFIVWPINDFKAGRVIPLLNLLDLHPRFCVSL